MGYEIVSCNFCGSKNYKHFDTIDGFNIVKCVECGFMYTNPRPPISDLGNFYSEEYYQDERHIKKYYNQDGTLKNDETDSESGIIQIENYVAQRGKILEIGAARGAFLKELKNRGWKTYGVEISSSACLIAKEQNGIDLFCGSFKDLEIPYLFDVICMYQTLEHLPDPKEVLQKCYENLNPNGLLVISVPNMKSFDQKISKTRKRLSFALPHHLNHFDHAFLKKELIKMGFTILETDLYYPNFILKLVNFINRVKKTTNDIKPSSDVASSVSTDLKLLKYKTTRKGKFLKTISMIFPGWKFTIVARKPVS